MKGRVLAWCLAGLAVYAVAIAVFLRWSATPPEADVVARDRPTPGLVFAPEFPYPDRVWVLEAIQKARPEARRLIDVVDAATFVTPYYDERTFWLGWAEPVAPGQYLIRFNLARLDGADENARDVVVLHELGHLVDAALVPDVLRDRLAADVPSTGCPNAFRGDCAKPSERFADTFAKWALRGEVAVGVGYGVPAPASLEDWGAPLADVAARL